jgi:hypothetical protein
MPLIYGTCCSVMPPTNVRWVPCHHRMARPQFVDGGESLLLWRVAANTLNKQTRMAEKGGPPARGLAVGLTKPHYK